MIQQLYFGWNGGVGHRVYTTAGSSNQHQWLTMLDGKLQPEERVEGLARLHHINGYTLIAFWDNSGDKRPGSNSIFAVNGKLDFKGALLLARMSFPDIFRRFAFEVRPEFDVEMLEMIRESRLSPVVTMLRMMLNRWHISRSEPHLIDLISDLRGWLALEPPPSTMDHMEVRFGDGVYEIKRTK